MRLLQQSNSGLSSNRYVRLMLLALTEMIIDTSVNIWILTSNIILHGGLEPVTSWAAVHSNFSRIQPYPQFLVPPKFWNETVAAWYIVPIATVSFWSFFAFGQESMAEYRAWYAWFRRVILRKSHPSTGDNLPSYSSNPTTRSSGTKKCGFRFKLRIPIFRSSGGSSSDSSSSQTAPATVRGKNPNSTLRTNQAKVLLAITVAQWEI
jgi:Pheromone A receptor